MGNPFGASDMRGEMLNVGTGKVIVAINDSGYADIVFKDIKLSMMMVDSAGDTNTVMSQSAPDMFIQDVKENGTIQGDVSKSLEPLAAILFPVPAREMGPGDSADLPLSIPFTIYGSKIMVKGYNRVTYAKQRGDTALLTTVINVDQYRLPADLDHQYLCYMKGTSSFKFDVAKGYFTEGRIDANMVMNNQDTTASKSMFATNLDMKTQILFTLLKVE